MSKSPADEIREAKDLWENIDPRALRRIRSDLAKERLMPDGTVHTVMMPADVARSLVAELDYRLVECGRLATSVAALEAERDRAVEALEEALPRIDEAAMEWIRATARHRRKGHPEIADGCRGQAKECSDLITRIRAMLESDDR